MRFYKTKNGAYKVMGGDSCFYGFIDRALHSDRYESFYWFYPATTVPLDYDDLSKIMKKIGKLNNGGSHELQRNV